MPTAMKMQEEMGDDIQILLVESQGHTLDDAEKMAYQKKWINDRSIWTTEQPFDTGAKGLPNYALLGNDGTLLSMGDPRSDHSKVTDLITEQLKLAKKGAKGFSKRSGSDPYTRHMICRLRCTSRPWESA